MISLLLKYKGRSVSLAFILLALGLLLYLLLGDRFHVVVKDRIYRSTQLSDSRLGQIIDARQIQTVINLRGAKPKAVWYQKEKKILDKKNIELIDIDFSADELPEITQLHLLLDALLTAPKPILLHCKHGVDRTGMASAIALAIEADAPLAELRRHISIRFGVAPFYPSTGPLLFDAYEKWLGENQLSHNRNQLISYLRDEYVDASGNIYYWIDGVNGVGFSAKPFNDDYWVELDRGQFQVTITGWAFDLLHQALVYGLEVSMGENGFMPVEDPMHLRPDVAAVLPMPDDLKRDPRVGWRGRFSIQATRKGCETLYLRFPLNNEENRVVKTRFNVCFDGELNTDN